MERVRQFLLRVYIVPFQSGLMMLIVYGAIINLLDFGVAENRSALGRALFQALGPIVARVVAVATLLAGSHTLIGLGLPRRDMEASGLVAVISIILIQSIVLTSAIGFGAAIINVWISNAIFSAACCTRLHSILTGRQALILHFGKIEGLR